MVLNLSPLAAHLQESLTSLRFATKVSINLLSLINRTRLSLYISTTGQQHDDWNSQKIHSYFVTTRRSRRLDSLDTSIHIACFRIRCDTMCFLMYIAINHLFFVTRAIIKIHLIIEFNSSNVRNINNRKKSSYKSSIYTSHIVAKVGNN